MLFAPGLIVKEFASRAIMPPSVRSMRCFAFRVSHDKTIKLSVFWGLSPRNRKMCPTSTRVRTAFDRLFSLYDSGMHATPMCRMSMKGAAMAMLSGLDGARFMASFGFLISEN